MKEFLEFVGDSDQKLRLLGNETHAFVGRRRSMLSKYGKEGALLLGKSAEKTNFGQEILLDALSPHVIFICGSRGSGKSYSLGVIAEELVLKNPNVACVVIDPIGIFWSMKYPNNDEKELKDLGDWGLEPQGIDKTQVFIPFGLRKRVPKETYDKLFSIRPAELTVDEWCLTFGLSRFSPTGLLLGKAIEKAKEKHKNFGLNDLIKTIEKDPELVSKEKGYKQDTRRALVSRFEAAKTWGILSKEGTTLSEICKEGHISVIDISFLEENVASLVIGMLSRKILNARKLMTRKTAMKKYALGDMDELLDVEIPPTWFFIDEAHTLIPSGNIKTAASNSLIEYVKQGRRPGCSLVFATQQPSAIDTKVLSQLDMLLCHKLVFDEDIKAVIKRMPTLLPKEYRKGRFLKRIPIGVALLGDRVEETSRAFSVKIRPRFSQHEGRETRSIELDEAIDPEKVKDLLSNLVYKKLMQVGNMSLQKVDETVETINRRYKLRIKSDDVIKKILKEKKCVMSEGRIFIPGFEEKAELEEKMQGMTALKIRINKEDIEKIVEKNRKKKTLGLFGKEETLKNLELLYEPVFKVDFDVILSKGYMPQSVYIDSDYEMYYHEKGKLKKTNDVKEVLDLNEKNVKVLNALKKTKDLKKISKITGFTPQAITRYLNDLVKMNLVKKNEEKKKYSLMKKLDIPKKLDVEKFARVDTLLEKVSPSNLGFEDLSVNEKVLKKIPTLFENCKVRKIEKFLKPVWKATYESKEGVRIQKFDAI